jgi:hypothetical protein
MLPQWTVNQVVSLEDGEIALARADVPALELAA